MSSRTGERGLPFTPQRILFIRLWGLGDVLLSTPAVHAARLACPAARIDYLTTRVGADALSGSPDIDHVHVVSKDAASMVRTLWQVRRARFEVVADFHSTPRTAYFVAASRARTRIGFQARGPRAALYTHPVPRSHGDEYLGSVLFRIVGPLGVNMHQPDLTLRMHIGQAERDWAERIWQQHQLHHARVVALSAVSLQSYKRWAPQRWASVADSLIERGVRVLMTHGPGEAEQVAQVIAGMRHQPVHNLDIVSVRQLAALYRRSHVWVGNDGGAKHVAVAAGTPTITISRHTFGPPWTDPNSHHRYIEHPPVQGCDLRCSACPHIGCLDAVTVDEVVSIVTETLRES